MLKGIVVACACALAVPAQARANEMGRTATVAPPEALPQQVYEVQERRSPGGVIVRDAIGGAALGALAGGGVAAYRRYVNNNGWGDWQRDVLIGAGIGLGVGLVIGIADAASADRTFTGPIADQRQSGFNSPMPVYGKRF
jgi:hypothetical protein